MRRLAFAFENLAPPSAPHRHPAIVARELMALANNLRPDHDRPRPKVIGLCEVIGHQLPTLVRYWRPLRNVARPGRANLALYVRSDMTVGEPHWHDLSETWPRTEHPGNHPPRSILSVEVSDLVVGRHWTVIVGHAPPLVPRSGDARREWLDVMVELMRKPHGPVLALTDPNGLGPDLVHRLRGEAVSGGTAVEAVHGLDVVLESVLTPNAVNGVPMLTDHGRALLGQARRFVHE